MPLTVGPGFDRGSDHAGQQCKEESHLQLIQSALVATIGIVLIGITIYLCYRYSDVLERLLGPNGTSIVVRLSAFILVCIGIQIMFNGADEFYTEMVKNAKNSARGALTGSDAPVRKRACGCELESCQLSARTLTNFLSCDSRHTSPERLFRGCFLFCDR